MREQFEQALKDAMRAKDKRRSGTLRLIIAALKDREIAARTEDKTLGDSDILAVLQKMVKQRIDSAKTYEDAGREELAAQEREEIAIIEEFLPQPLSEDEVAAAISEAVAEVGADSLKDMGKVMAVLKERHAGRMDFGKASGQVKKALGA